MQLDLLAAVSCCHTFESREMVQSGAAVHDKRQGRALEWKAGDGRVWVPAGCDLLWQRVCRICTVHTSGLMDFYIGDGKLRSTLTLVLKDFRVLQLHLEGCDLNIKQKPLRRGV